MAIKEYYFYCDFCGYKRKTDGTDIHDLIPIGRSPLMISPPKLDSVTKEHIPAKFKAQLKMFKCPNCGRAISPKKVKTNVKKESEDYPSGHQTSNEG
jgi:predicted RNA-binding Zn-ribbon protein involved in translation (DUF1610 family)